MNKKKYETAYLKKYEEEFNKIEEVIESKAKGDKGEFILAELMAEFHICEGIKSLNRRIGIAISRAVRNGLFSGIRRVYNANGTPKRDCQRHAVYEVF